MANCEHSSVTGCCIHKKTRLFFRIIMQIPGKRSGNLLSLFMIFFLGLACQACSSNISSTSTPSELVPAPEVNQGIVNIGLPARVKIPKIQVDAAIVQVGLTPARAMDVPKKLSDVAWYKMGPRPGEQGSAVLAGHHSHKASVPAVFDNLRNLAAGDYIYIQDEQGQTLTFIVQETRMYNQGDRAEEVFFRRDSRYLNLITCEGNWLEEQKSYDKRLVVFASCVN